MKQETAIEWFVDELQRAGWIPKDSSIMNYVILEAKKMEKEQIIEAWNNGYDEEDRATSNPNQYYNETFKSEQNANNKPNTFSLSMEGYGLHIKI